ncbi:DUF3450 family protein [Kiritimatiella glycovorans]|uniref:DUF3450 family protein n=1 Tax=Kiritimatiella glycovorans TaxID=1307763 RepID=A0A0G3EG79_9BACT|nr:DUF3450 family protein [Kiritimatiella glycovorans]AKJ65466.1 hypothetical protein L21SP4_02239 [Kiritimatiella glycovorans]
MTLRSRITPLVAAAALAMPLYAGPDPDMATARQALDQYVETQRLISEEKQAWREAEQMLHERIELVQEEIESLRKKIGEARSNIGHADEKRRELQDENETLKQATETVRGRIGPLEARVRELVVRLPQPLRDTVKPLSRKIPDNPGDTSLSLSQRYQNVVGLLNEVNKFNRRIVIASEVRPLPDGEQAEVETMYVGLGQAWYANLDGTRGGVGRPGSEGWTWEPVGGLGPEVKEAIAIYRNEKPAVYKPLPVHISGGEAK